MKNISEDSKVLRGSSITFEQARFRPIEASGAYTTHVGWMTGLNQRF